MQSLCVRFATTVASGHATLATKRTLLLTWAGLPPAGSHQLCLAHSLNHLVGDCQQSGWHLDAKRLRGLKIDDQLYFRRLLGRHVGGPLAFKNVASVIAHQTPGMSNISTIAHQTSSSWKFPNLMHGGHLVAQCERGKQFAPAVQEWIGGDHERAGSQLCQGCKNRIEITLGAGLKDMKPQFAFFRRQFQLPHERLCKGGTRWINEKSYAGGRRHHFVEQFELLRS